MKPLFYALTISMLLSSCINKKNYDDKASLENLKHELISKFGENAYYTKLNISNGEYCAIVSVHETDKPSSMEMREWDYMNDCWKQISKTPFWQQAPDISMDTAKNTKDENFMFQLHKTIDFNTLGKVLEQAKKKVMDEKNTNDVKVDNIFINAPTNGDVNSMKYFIRIRPESGDTDFNFWYNLDGTLDRLDYQNNALFYKTIN